jgi:hypothetical protein
MGFLRMREEGGRYGGRRGREDLEAPEGVGDVVAGYMCGKGGMGWAVQRRGWWEVLRLIEIKCCLEFEIYS